MNQLRNGGFDQPLLAGPGVYSGVNRALERFYKLIAPGGVGLPLKRAAYRDAARCFFFDLAYLGMACNPGATHFLEKTRHNLLAPQFLADFVGLPWCVHVIRDPRATAWSLMAQDWGPNTLSSAASWVQSYYEQWFAVRGLYATLGLSLTELRIEDVVADPSGHADHLLSALNLARMPVFANIDGNQLIAGRSSIGADDMRLLDDKLGQVAAKLGHEAIWTKQ